MPYSLPKADVRISWEALGIISRCPNVARVLRQAEKAAEVSDVTVLIQGETGTGKQLLAQNIHELDQKRRGFPFVTVHCSTVSEALAESEMFGHQRGAFSGAVSERKGLFQAAHRGSLFLDDVNDLPFHLQPKLLDAIQRGIVRPVGSDREVKLDVRIIAACNQPLEPMVSEGRFRADLYHRLHVVKLCLQPLRERGPDIPELSLALAHRYRSLYEPIESVDPALIQLLQSRPFPGNVRELENAIQRMLFLKIDGTSLTVADWMTQCAPEGTTADADLFAEAARAVWQIITSRGVPYARAIQEIEKRILETAIGVDGATRRSVAQRLRTSERTLYYKMRNHHLSAAAR